MNSCIYNGEVTHTRFKPVRHFLKYKTFSLLIDLDEINLLDKSIGIFSYNKFNIFSFFDKDHGDRDGSTLTNWVKKNMPGKSTCAAASAVLKSKNKYKPNVVKMANFANNFGCKK